MTTPATPTTDLLVLCDKLDALAEKATPDGKLREWFVLDQPWLESGCQPMILAGSPDPHVATPVCDFITADIAGVEDKYTDEEWESRNWALAEFIAALDPSTIKLLTSAIRAQAPVSDAEVEEIRKRLKYCMYTSVGDPLTLDDANTLLRKVSELEVKVKAGAQLRRDLVRLSTHTYKVFVEHVEAYDCAITTNTLEPK